MQARMKRVGESQQPTLGEVKFMCRPWEGVNNYSPEAKFTGVWHLPSLFELFGEVTCKPVKASF